MRRVWEAVAAGPLDRSEIAEQSRATVRSLRVLAVLPDYWTEAVQGVVQGGYRTRDHLDQAHLGAGVQLLQLVLGPLLSAIDD